MNEMELEQLMEEMASAVKAQKDISIWEKNKDTSPYLTIISNLNSTPRTSIPSPDLSRVRNQILDRISVPALEKHASWFTPRFAHIARLSVGFFGSFLIMASLSLGVAAAALQSVPGQTIYPLKKIVENVQLKLTPEDQQVALQLKFADNRIEELTQVLDQQSQGKVSSEVATKIVSQTVKDIKQNTSAAVKAAVAQPKVVDKLADISNKLQAASVQSEGEVKIQLEQAAADTQVSQQEAIKNIQDAGGTVNTPTTPPTTDQVTAHGKLTAATRSYVSVGSAKFTLTDDTVYVNIKPEDLQVDLLVDIEGQVTKNKTYATKITAILEPQTSGDDTEVEVKPIQTDDSDTVTIPDSQ
ncbi:MAG TPA: DUF5667 domain-containing protein [Methylomirabilota bacterium]|jgi:hypothetical protein|nr:DUF5667 domain-containing protein [Methylomirabilota bacterium]